MSKDKTEQYQHMIEGGIHLIPRHMRGAVRNYFYLGIPPGGFLTAVLSNDLMGALGRADDINQVALPQYAQFLYCHAPPTSFGSINIVNNWINSFKEEEVS